MKGKRKTKEKPLDNSQIFNAHPKVNPNGIKIQGKPKDNIRKTKWKPKKSHRKTIENHWKAQGEPSEQQKEYIRKTRRAPEGN